MQARISSKIERIKPYTTDEEFLRDAEVLYNLMHKKVELMKNPSERYGDVVLEEGITVEGLQEEIDAQRQRLYARKRSASIGISRLSEKYGLDSIETEILLFLLFNHTSLYGRYTTNVGILNAIFKSKADMLMARRYFYSNRRLVKSGLIRGEPIDRFSMDGACRTPFNISENALRVILGHRVRPEPPKRRNIERLMGECAADRRGRIPDFKELVNTIRPEASLNDLVFSKSTRDRIFEIVEILKNRKKFESIGFGFLYKGKGFCILFSGPSGTGKTITAEAIARELGQPLHIINYSQVEDMWLGNSEKRIVEIFRHANKKRGVLLFDEADFLLTRRGSVAEREYEGGGGSRYLNREVNILLQELDRFSGIAIFSTNFSINLDRAFERRIPFRVLFENPDATVREKLWRVHIPENVILGKDVDLKSISTRYEFNGGEIRNIVRNSVIKAFIESDGAERVRVSMKNIEDAIKQEFDGMRAMNYALSGELYQFGKKVEGGGYA
jgi:SpoVK/Ycf46/Vps4 family AAA+-type ATPase